MKGSHRVGALPERVMQAEADRQTGGLAAMAVLLALVIVGLFLVRTLHRKSSVEDCMLMGRANCELTVVLR